MFKENLAIAFLGLIALAAVIFGGVAGLNGDTVPDSVIAIGSAAGGALAGIVVVQKNGGV